MSDRDAVISAAAEKAFVQSQPAEEVKQETVVETVVEETQEEIPLDLDEVQTEEAVDEQPSNSKARKLLEEGKLDDAFKEAFGKPLSYFKIDDAKFAALRRQEKSAWAEIDQAKDGIDKANQLNEQAKNALQQEWGDIAKGIKAGKNGDVISVVNAAAKMANMDPVELIKAFVKGSKTLENKGSNVNEAYEKRIKDLEEKLDKAGKPEDKTPEDKTKQLQETYDYISEKLEDHDVSKLRGYAKLVFSEIAAVYKATGKQLTEEQAADRVIAKKKKEVEALGFIKPEGKPNKSGKTRTGTAPRPDSPTLSRDEQIAAAARASFGKGR